MGNVEGRLKALRALRESGGIAKFPAVVRASSYASGRCLTGFWPLQTALCSVVASIGSNVVGNIGSDVVSQMTAGFWLPSPPTTLGADGLARSFVASVSRRIGGAGSPNPPRWNIGRPVAVCPAFLMPLGSRQPRSRDIGD